MALPKQYQWLEIETGPVMLKEALRHYGKLETPGPKNNPEMIRWAKEVGADVANVYKADSIPWCKINNPQTIAGRGFCRNLKITTKSNYMTNLQPQNEVFKSIVGYEGLYEISNFGRVKSVARLSSNGSKLPELFMAPQKNSKGYLMVQLKNKNGAAKTIQIHRLVAIAFIDNPFNYPMVNHKDTDKANNHYLNLEWCNNSYNTKHAHDNGLMAHVKYATGEKHGSAIHTEATIIEIKKWISNGYRNCEIARRFNVSNPYIAKIRNGSRWGWLKTS